MSNIYRPGQTRGDQGGQGDAQWNVQNLPNSTHRQSCTEMSTAVERASERVETGVRSE